ncbi:flavodoxin domain-containing protein [Fredinandcohnia sp. 179-A 10B2 NHS]|uniref:flavodoxin domain-containing protein n=1 Tax=Fredinandcohnia sp. 179-A 10B2 NHS TaxID=3235176 RepID=UPI0039A2D4A9
MNVGIVYTSVTGNTEEVKNVIEEYIKEYSCTYTAYPITEFPLSSLRYFDIIMIGTYTWGNGEIPNEMLGLYKAFEQQNTKKIVTGVFGTGDQCYPSFCGAVDGFRDMLYTQTDLAATLKIELLPQQQDYGRCKQFVEVIVRRYLKE